MELYMNNLDIVKAKRILELDADGVLLDIHSPLTLHLSEKYPMFNVDKHIRSWSMRELDAMHPTLRSDIFTLFGNPDYIASMPVYSDVPEALLNLGDFAKANDFVVVINTNSFVGCEDAKAHALNNLLNLAPVDCLVNIQTTKEKEMLNSVLSIEDNADNLKRSDAKYKYLIRRCHNIGVNEGYFSCGAYAKVVNSFSEAVKDFIECTAKLTR